MCATGSPDKWESTCQTVLLPLAAELETLYSRPYSPLPRKRNSVTLLGETLKLCRLIGLAPVVPVFDWAGPKEVLAYCQQQIAAELENSGRSTALLEAALVEGGFRRVSVEESQMSTASKCLSLLSELLVAGHASAMPCGAALFASALEVLRSTRDLPRCTQALSVLSGERLCT